MPKQATNFDKYFWTRWNTPIWNGKQANWQHCFDKRSTLIYLFWEKNFNRTVGTVVVVIPQSKGSSRQSGPAFFFLQIHRRVVTTQISQKTFHTNYFYSEPIFWKNLNNIYSLNIFGSDFLVLPYVNETLRFETPSKQKFKKSKTCWDETLSKQATKKVDFLVFHLSGKTV